MPTEIHYYPVMGRIPRNQEEEAMVATTETTKGALTETRTRRVPRLEAAAKAVRKLRGVVAEAADRDPKIPWVVLVAQVDPDAVGSAFGMVEALRLLGDYAVVVYSGVISHPQNEALCNKLDLLSRMDSVSAVAAAGALLDNGVLCNPTVLVDSGLSIDSRLPFKTNPLVVVDHHQGSDVESTEGTLVWVDGSAGSASTMVLEILAELAPEDWEFPEDLALMLALGVHSDTKQLVSCGARDEAAYSWAKRHASKSDLRQLIRYKRSWRFRMAAARATQWVDEKDSFRHGRLGASLGLIPDKHGDDLAMIGDDFLLTTGVVVATTWAILEVKDEKTGDVTYKVRACARSEDLSLNLKDLLLERFGKASGAKILPDSLAEGGALMEIEVGPWWSAKEMVAVIDRRMLEWLFEDHGPEEED